jgi:hypothetical protein
VASSVFLHLQTPRAGKSSIAEGEFAAGEIASRFNVSPPAISQQHLKVLAAGAARARSHRLAAPDLSA